MEQASQVSWAYYSEFDGILDLFLFLQAFAMISDFHSSLCSVIQREYNGTRATRYLVTHSKSDTMEGENDFDSQIRFTGA
jgi:hypothetical protein